MAVQDKHTLVSEALETRVRVLVGRGASHRRRRALHHASLTASERQLAQMATGIIPEFWLV